MAVSAVIPLSPFKIKLILVCCTPIDFESLYVEITIGIKNSSCGISPGCMFAKFS